MGAYYMQCPYCAEEIKDNAIVCKHCHRDLTFYTPLSQRINELESRISKMERVLKSSQAAYQTNTIAPQSRKQTEPALFYVIVLAISFIVSTATYAFYVGLPASREWALLLSILTPLFAGIVIGLVAAERSLGNMLAVGVSSGLLASVGVVGVLTALGRNIDWIAVATLYFLPPSLLLFLGGFPGEWLAQKLGWRAQKPYYARALAQAVVGQQYRFEDDAEKDKRLDRLTKTIAALAPLLTFLASILAAGLAYLSAK